MLADLKVGDAGHEGLHRAIRNRLLSVNEYGADYTGVSDCSLAFQSSLPNIIVPVGDYSFENSITTEIRPVLSGYSRNASILYGRSSLAGSILSMPNGGFHISNVMFVMQNGKPAIQGTGVLTDGIIENCWFNGAAALQSEPLIIGFGNNLVIDKCTFERASHAIKFIGGAGSYITISNCIFWDISNTMLEFNNVSGINLSNIFFECRRVEDIQSAIAVFQNCTNINLSNIVFSKVWDAPAENFSQAMQFTNCDVPNLSNVVEAFVI